jgi:putative transposase
MGRLTHRTAPGSVYFVSTKAWANRNIFQAVEIAEIVIDTLFRHRTAGAYLLHEFVLMPDHLHLLLTPGQTTTLEKAIQLIKGGSSYEIHKRRGHRMEIWQPGFKEWTVRDPRDFRVKAQCIRNNPVAAKLADAPEQWPYSSARSSFELDPTPVRFSLGAKAHNTGASAISELKLRPPRTSTLSSEP